MSKFDSYIAEIAVKFGQTYEFTEQCFKKHGIVTLPRFRQPYDGLDAFYSDMTGHNNTEPSMTKQEFAADCDPNTLLDRHARGQDISMFLTSRTPRYIDVSDMPTDYHTALNIVTRAKQDFMQLDAKIRAKFNNDPGAFYDFAVNPENKQSMIDMGFAEPVTPVSSPSPTDSAPAASAGGGEGA